MLQPSEPPQVVYGSPAAHVSGGESGDQAQHSGSYQHQHHYTTASAAHVTPHQTYPSAHGSLSETGYGMQGPPVPQQVPTSQLGDQGAALSAKSGPQRPSLWKWVSMKEVVFVFLACSITAALFRVRDSATFNLAWEERLDPLLYGNGKFPLNSEKLPTPIVTDLDNDGVSDILMLTYDEKLKLVHTPVLKHPFKTTSTALKVTHQAELNLADHVDVGIKPVAMATGFLRSYQSMVQVRRQVVAVLMSDWSVLCLDHRLRLLWKTTPLREHGEGDSIVEGTVLVSPVGIHKGDLGSIIVGGREFNSRKPEDSMKRMRRGKLDEVDTSKMLDSLGRFSVYALEGRGGEVRWHFTPGDTDFVPAFSPTISTYHHLKLAMNKQFVSRDGEVSWHQYSASFRQLTPHTWQRGGDTHFELAHFKKDKKNKGEKPGVTNHIAKVSDLTVDHIAGLAFGGQQPHSASEHIVDPNVLVIHSVKGISVIHLYQGRPLCSLRLSPYHSTHADVNGDGTIDHVHAVVNPGEASLTEDQGGESDCYGKAVPMAMASRPLFKHSICKASHWTETFINTDKWVPAVNRAGRKRVDHSITEPLAPIVLESSYHSIPLKLHLGGGGWDVMGLYEGTFNTPTPSLPSLSKLTTHHQGPMYDSVFVLSSGRVTSVGPQGEFNWQVDTPADWDEASGLIYNPEHRSWKERPQEVMFAHGGFVPSAVPFSPKVYGKKDHILISGWNVVVLLSGADGSMSASLWPNCQPVAPLVMADFTGDGLNDIIVTCADKYIGLSLSYQSGFWQTTVLSVFVSCVIVIVAVYTRQKTVGLFPTMKAAQD